MKKRKKVNKFINFKNVIEWGWENKCCDYINVFVNEYNTINYTLICLKRFRNGVAVFDINDNFKGFCSFNESNRELSNRILILSGIKHKIGKVDFRMFVGREHNYNFSFELNENQLEGVYTYQGGNNGIKL